MVTQLTIDIDKSKNDIYKVTKSLINCLSSPLFTLIGKLTSEDIIYYAVNHIVILSLYKSPIE